MPPKLLGKRSIQTEPVKKKRKTIISISDSDDEENGSYGEDWTTKYAPKRSADVPLSKKFVEDVRDWMKKILEVKVHRGTLLNRLYADAPEGRDIVKAKYWPNTLVLVGHSGNCKYSLVDSLARELNVEIELFQARQNMTWKQSNAQWESKDYGDVVVDYESELDSLKQFLKQTRTNSLFTTKKKLFVVKELPHCPKGKKKTLDAILKAHTGFSAAQKYQHRTKDLSPTIILHTVLDASNVVASMYQSFSPELLASGFIKIVSLQEITTVRITKVLKNIISTEKKNPSQGYNLNIRTEIFSQIASNAEGDLRQAINQLQYYCRRSNKRGDGSAKAILSFPKKKKTRIRKQVNSITRDKSLEIFHATGKLIYAKRDANRKLEFNVDKIGQRLSYSCDKLISFTHNNLLATYTDKGLKELAETLETLSFSDSLSVHSPYNQQTEILSYNVAARGLTYYNQKNRAKMGYQPLRAPERREDSINPFLPKNHHFQDPNKLSELLDIGPGHLTSEQKQLRENLQPY